MQAQAKYMKSNWSSACRLGGHGNLTSSNKWFVDGKYLNTIIASAMEKVLKCKNKYKAKTKGDSKYDIKSEHFKFENPYINFESDS